jgi:hypothetical protein
VFCRFCDFISQARRPFAFDPPFTSSDCFLIRCQSSHTGAWCLSFPPMHPFLDFPFSSFAHFLLSLSAIAEKRPKNLPQTAMDRNRDPLAEREKKKNQKKESTSRYPISHPAVLFLSIPYTSDFLNLMPSFPFSTSLFL